MVKNKLFLKIFSSGLQAVSVQLLGGIFYYFISIYLSKGDFGIFSWTNAVSVFITTLLGCGLEQVVVRRIAASGRSDWAAAAYFVHSAIGFAITFVFLLLLNKITHDTKGLYKNLPWFFMAQGLLFIALPFKQFLNAKERFTPFGIISVVSNAGKIVAAWLLVHGGVLKINEVLYIMIITGAFELAGLLLYVSTKTTFSFRFRISAYYKLLRESAAQYISVIFDSSLSRMDWILLGVMTSTSVLADYSFAYRAYELAKLPMLIIAPIILPRFAKLLSVNNKIEPAYQEYINSFNVIELFFAAGIPLVLNIIWVPLLSMMTNGKYGASNATEFSILSLCIPLQFFINLLWSLSFGAKRYKQVSSITVICAIGNIVLNVLVIPKFGGIGAAAAFLTTMVLQAGLYYRLVRRDIISLPLLPLFIFTAEAATCYLVVKNIHINFILQLIAGCALYLLIAVAMRQVTKQHFKNFKHVLTQ